MKKISIIIPIYNVEKYIERGIKSLLKQNKFEEFEFIFVNDGSTDNSLKIINKYIKKFSNFVLINKDNGGVSSARNEGLKKATGKYICFFDPDDEVEENYFESMYETIFNTNYDLISVNFKVKFENLEMIDKFKVKKIQINNKDEIIRQFLSSGKMANNLFNKIFKAKIARKIHFNEKIKIGEDMLYIYEFLKECSNILIDTGINGYIYYKNETSAMNSNFNIKFLDALNVSKNITESEKNTKNYKYAYAHEQHERCKLLEYMKSKKCEKEYKEIWKKEYRSLREYSIIGNFKYLNLRQNIGILLMKISPKLYLKVFKIMRIG